MKSMNRCAIFTSLLLEGSGLPSAPTALFFRIIPQSIGVRVNDARSENKVRYTTIKPNCFINGPAIPLTKAIGVKTTRSVPAEAMTAPVTSLAPNIAASKGSSPFSRCDSLYDDDRVCDKCAKRHGCGYQRPSCRSKPDRSAKTFPTRWRME